MTSVNKRTIRHCSCTPLQVYTIQMNKNFKLIPALFCYWLGFEGLSGSDLSILLHILFSLPTGLPPRLKAFHIPHLHARVTSIETGLGEYVLQSLIYITNRGFTWQEHVP